MPHSIPNSRRKVTIFRRRLYNGKDSAIPAVLASAVTEGTDGGLVKEGEGTLTLSAQPTYTGVTEVKAGTLSLGAAITSLSGGVRLSGGSVVTANTTFPGSIVVSPGAEFVYDSSVTYSGITLEEGAKMIVNVKNYTSGMEMTLPSVTIPEDASMEDMVIFNVGHRAKISVRTDATTGKIIATITDTTDAVTTRWTNASGDGLWSTASNWTFGVPTAGDTAKVENGATITGTINTTNEVATLEVAGAVEIRSNDSSNGKEFMVKVGAVTGSGSLTLNRINLAATQALTIPATVTLVAKCETANRISFVTGAADAIVTIPGMVQFPENGGDHNCLRLSYCNITGTLEVNSYNGDYYYLTSSAANTLIFCTFSGKMTGSGHMLYEGAKLGGDFSEFTGTMAHNYSRDCTLVGPIDAHQAKWVFGRTTLFDVTNGGTFKFGWVSNTAERVFFPNSTDDIVMGNRCAERGHVPGMGAVLQGWQADERSGIVCAG